MSKCNAPGCSTTENTRIDERSIALFSFPTYDDSLVKQWEENSQVRHNLEKNPMARKLCQLHFESDCFVSEEKNVLAPGAVPTIFDFGKKKKSMDEKEADDPKEPPMKQSKLMENEVLRAQKTAPSPLQSPPIQSKPETLVDDPRSSKAKDCPQSIQEKSAKSLIKKDGSSSIFTRQIDMGKKAYRLIIRIDKVITAKDEGKKIELVAKESVEVKQQKLANVVMKNGGVVRPCSKTGCKLIKTTLNSKPVFRCERCGKYYVVKENKVEKSNWTCQICKEVLPSPESLGIHVKEHLICDMCQAHCSTQISYDKHLMLHVSTDPLLPYKCHKCASAFEVKADVRQHYAEKHFKNSKQDNRAADSRKQKSSSRPSQKLFRCEYCYAVFKREQAYKSHVDLHMGDGYFDCALCSKRFRTAKHLAAHQTRHLGTFKFTCQVCSKEFSSLDGVDTHMKTHMEVSRAEHRCNICEKVFKNESVLSNHMQAHLSRAHRCPVCNKAFINKTTLRIHFKSHSKDVLNINDRDLTGKKRHTCTLCPNTFESRSRLYNHIMTHLEQMHGREEDEEEEEAQEEEEIEEEEIEEEEVEVEVEVEEEEEEGGNVVLDGLNEFLEREEDRIVS